MQFIRDGILHALQGNRLELNWIVNFTKTPPVSAFKISLPDALLHYHQSTTYLFLCTITNNGVDTTTKDENNYSRDYYYSSAAFNNIMRYTI